jgi:hypothetical protein
VLTVSCKSKKSPAEFIKWVSNCESCNHNKKTIGEYTFEFIYIPAAYFVLVNQKDPSSIAEEELSEGLEGLNGVQHYQLKISSGSKDLLKHRLTSEEEYYERISYYSGLVEKDIMLIDGKDTLECLFCHFERNYGLTPFIHLNLAFKDINGSVCSKTLVFNDVVFGNGPVMIKISSESLKKIPALKIL